MSGNGTVFKENWHSVQFSSNTVLTGFTLSCSMATVAKALLLYSRHRKTCCSFPTESSGVEDHYEVTHLVSDDSLLIILHWGLAFYKSILKALRGIYFINKRQWHSVLSNALFMPRLACCSPHPFLNWYIVSLLACYSAYQPNEMKPAAVSLLYILVSSRSPQEEPE